MDKDNLLMQLKELLPTGHLSIESEELRLSAEYKLEQQGNLPICILYPGNSDELESIIHFANKNRLNLTVTSSTGIHRKGGITNLQEHILIDLSQWKKIDLIDRRNRVCRIEPGVTYSELISELASHGMSIPIPLAPRTGKSVLATVMDREPSTWSTRQWDSGDPVCSTEFFFGSGEKFRTGAAGGPGTIEQQRESGGAQKHSAGPSQTDFHRVIMGSQGTMGIVNWITIRTELLPTIQESFLVCNNELEHLLDYVYAVQRGQLGEESFIFNRTALSLLLSNADTNQFESFRDSLPEFVCLQSIAGFERLAKGRLKYHKQDIQKIARQNNLQLEPIVENLSAKELYKKMNTTCGEIDWRDLLKGNSLSIIFQSTLNRVPSLLNIFMNTSLNFGVDKSEIGIYIQPMVQNHACHVELIIPVDITSSEQVENVKLFEKDVTNLLMESGAFFSRPYGFISELIWDKNPINKKILNIVKGIFDPNNVLQRGKWFSQEQGEPFLPMKERDLSELENIVGKKWLFTAPCVLDTYAFYMNPEIMNKDGSQWLPRPAAVVLPKSVEEIQEIMRFCSTSRYMAKPISTGFHCAGAASNDKVILIDLKRMNQIVELDIKNQIAVIEPYIRAIDLQTEIIQHGLNCHIVSSGSNHSLLASHTAAWGYGFSGNATSFSGRNLLGLEWVLPSGEVITLGSKGSGCGWFTADGPGPSLRGIVRGFSGTLGGLGVFTKCAIKLYKWDGPREWEFKGKSPKYILKKVPKRCALHAIAFPSRNREQDAGYKMGEAELNYGEFRTPMFFSALALTENNEELKVALDSGVFHKIGQNILSCSIFAASDAEFKWKMKALKQIMRETKGVIVPMNLPLRPKVIRLLGLLTKPIPDPLFMFRLPLIGVFLQDLVKYIPFWNYIKLEKQSTLFWLLFRNAVNTQASFRPSQGMATMLGAFDTWDLAHTQAEYIAKIKRPYIEQGLIIDDDGDLGCGGSFEQGHLGYLEGIILYDPSNPQSAMAARDLVETGIRDTIDNAMGTPIAAFGVEANEIFGPVCSNYHIWLERIKTALDPNTASDPFFYARVKEDLRKE